MGAVSTSHKTTIERFADALEEERVFLLRVLDLWHSLGDQWRMEMLKERGRLPHVVIINRKVGIPAEPQLYTCRKDGMRPPT